MWKKEQRNENIKSFIAEGVEFKGQLYSKGSLRLDGIVDGIMNVEGDLIIGPTGFSKGEVKAGNIILGGKMDGNLSASGRLEITSTGQLYGDIKCNVITIEEGGILEGSTRMSGNKAVSVVEKPASIQKNAG